MITAKHLYLFSIVVLSACASAKSTPSSSTAADGPTVSEQTTAVELPPAEAFRSDIAFVPSISEGTISALDLVNNKVAWTLEVSAGADDKPPQSAMGIASTRDAKLVFTADAATNEVVVVDGTSQKIWKRIPVDHGVHAINICPHDHWVFVSGRLPDYPWLTKTTVINAKDLSVAGALAPGLGNSAHYAFTPDGKEAWAASVSTNLAWVVDVATRSVTDVIPLIPGDLEGTSPEGKMGLIGLNEVAISPDGQRAFLVGPEAGTVFAVDVPSRNLVASKRVGERTHGVGVTRDGREVWTANNTGTITILDPKTLEILGQVDMREHVTELTFAHIAFSVDGKTAYVSWERDVGVIDVASRKIVDVIEVGTGPHEISLEDFFIRSSGRVTGSSDTAATPAAPTSSAKSSSAGGVTVEATMDRDPEGQLHFTLALNTHSRDLMASDLAATARVEVNGKLGSRRMSGSLPARTRTIAKAATTIKAPAGADVKLVLPDVGGTSHELMWTRE